MIARIALFLILFLALPCLVYPKPSRYATPAPTPKPETGPTRDQLFQTVDHIVRLSQDLQKNLDAEKAAHENTDISLKKATKENFDLQRKIDKDTSDFNTLKDKYASQSKKLAWYRWHWWGSWIIFGLGILACGFFAFLKLTGRLAIFGTAVAAKIP